MAYNPLNPNGQATMANSQPVVIASNQSPVSVAGTVNITGNPSVSGQLGSSIIGTVPVTQVTNPWIITGSVQASITPAANQSVSGTVGASIIGLVPIVGSISGSVGIVGTPSISGTVQIGNFPTTQNISGSVAAFQGTTPWVITGSIQGSFSPAANQSVSGTVQVDVRGSVATVIIGGSIAASFTPPANQSVSGTVQTDVRSSVAVVIIGGSILTSSTANQSVSGTLGASVIGTVPVTQSTTPWVIGSIYGNISGSVAAIITNTNINVSGSVAAWLQSTNASVITVGSPVANQSISGTVGASIIGLVPVVLSSGSILAVPTGNQSVSGSVNIPSLLSMPGIVSSTNSTTTPVTSTLSFTGTGEEWKDFGSIVINVFTDAASGTDGLSIQQSSDNTNWDIRDTYTISSMASGQGKTFQVQPAARFGRIVYTQGPVNSGAFRLQTIYHPQMVKPTSQRAQDGYSNETDLEQVQTFPMLYNGVNWDRWRGNSSIGALMYGSVTTIQSGTRITSIVGGYAEDAPATSGDIGILTLGARNDTMASVTSTDGDYGTYSVGPVGEILVANSPITKWVSGVGSLFTGIIQPIIPAQGSSIFTYVTSYQIVNSSANNVYLTLYSGSTSVIGYATAPANGGSNVILPNALKSRPNADFSASVSGVASVYMTAEGFISKV